MTGLLCDMGLVFCTVLCTAALFNPPGSRTFPQKEAWRGISQLHSSKELSGGFPSLFTKRLHGLRALKEGKGGRDL